MIAEHDAITSEGLKRNKTTETFPNLVGFSCLGDMYYSTDIAPCFRVKAVRFKATIRCL